MMRLILVFAVLMLPQFVDGKTKKSGDKNPGSYESKVKEADALFKEGKYNEALLIHFDIQKILDKNLPPEKAQLEIYSLMMKIKKMGMKKMKS